MNLEKQADSTTKKGLNGVFWNVGGSVIQIFSHIVIIGVLARLLTPEEFGVVAIIMILVTFSELFTHMGIGSALIQLPQISKSHISLSYTLSVVIGLMVGILFFLLAPYASSFFNIEEAKNAFRFFAIFFPIRSFISITMAILTRDLQFPVIVRCGILIYLLGTGPTSISLAFMGFGYWALIWGQFAGLLLTLFVMIYLRRPTFSIKYEKNTLNDLLFFGSGHTLGTIFNYFAENADNIIIGKLLGTVAMGVYSKAFQLLAIPSKFFGSIFDKVLFPILSKKQDKKEKLTAFYLFFTSICFGLLLPISVLIFINAELIVEVLLGPQWNDVVLPMQILILGLAFRFGTKINKLYLKSMGLVYRGAYYQFIFAILMTVCCSLGGYWYELPGVASGVFVATILNYFQVVYRLFKNLKFQKSTYINIIGKTILYNVPYLILTLTMYQFELTSKWFHLGISFSLYMPIMIYLFLNKNNIVFSEENFEILSQILRAFPSRIKKKLVKTSFLKRYYD